MNLSLLLSYQDSNLDKQNQNLLCYHYTIVQSRFAPAKLGRVFLSTKFILQ